MQFLLQLIFALELGLIVNKIVAARPSPLRQHRGNAQFCANIADLMVHIITPIDQHQRVFPVAGLQRALKLRFQIERRLPGMTAAERFAPR